MVITKIQKLVKAHLYGVHKENESSSDYSQFNISQ